MDGQAEQELLDLSRRWMQAIQDNDAAWLDALLAPEYALVFAHPQRAAMPRERWLAFLPEYRVHDFAFHHVTVTVFGDFATVCSQLEQRATVAGDDRSGTFVLTDSWTRQAGRWQVLQRHSVMLPHAHGPGSVIE